MKRDYVTLAEAARLSRVSAPVLRRQMDAGTLPGFRLPGAKHRHRRIRLADLRRYLHDQNIPTDLIDQELNP